MRIYCWCECVWCGDELCECVNDNGVALRLYCYCGCGSRQKESFSSPVLQKKNHTNKLDSHTFFWIIALTFARLLLQRIVNQLLGRYDRIRRYAAAAADRTDDVPLAGADRFGCWEAKQKIHSKTVSDRLLDKDHHSPICGWGPRRARFFCRTASLMRSTSYW